MTSTYQYSPVISEYGDIRLLTIHGGQNEMPLKLSLCVKHRLENFNQSAPARAHDHSDVLLSGFEALSYAWGDPADLVTIMIGNESLSVTRNLAEALPYLRLPDLDRLFWIDAICVNQGDNQERSLQIQLIAKIFQQAKQVVCWLGTQSSTSDLALKMMENLSEKIEIDIPAQVVTVVDQKNDVWADMEAPLPYTAREIEALYELLSRPWFERLWIFQEIRLAADTAVLQCGHNTLAWQAVMKASWCFQYKRWEIEPPNGFEKRLRMLRQMCNQNQTNLGLLIRRTVHFKCLDPRDRVYALMSLRREEEQQLPIKADYTESAGKVYQHYVHEYISKLRNLRFITFCEFKANRQICDVPSWVPDWSSPPYTNNPQAQQYASGYMHPEIIGISGNTLSVAGVYATIIQESEPISIQIDDSDTTTSELLRAHAPLNVLSDSYPRGDITVMDAYCSTMCHNTFDDCICPPRPMFPAFADSREAVRSAITEVQRGDTMKYGASVSRYYAHVRDVCVGRAFVTTTDGRIGLAPASAQPGDHVVTILGCRSLMLLRPLQNAKYYQVIGMAYIHGLNNGEPLFGPLPSGWRPVLLCENGHFTKQLFYDPAATSTQQRYSEEDPRLADFGDSEICQGLYFEGRAPTVAALRARGRDVKTFHLV